jgi:hypothetical protein
MRQRLSVRHNRLIACITVSPMSIAELPACQGVAYEAGPLSRDPSGIGLAAERPGRPIPPPRSPRKPQETRA